MIFFARFCSNLVTKCLYFGFFGSCRNFANFRNMLFGNMTMENEA